MRDRHSWIESSCPLCIHPGTGSHGGTNWRASPSGCTNRRRTERDSSGKDRVGGCQWGFEQEPTSFDDSFSVEKLGRTRTSHGILPGTNFVPGRRAQIVEYISSAVG